MSYILRTYSATKLPLHSCCPSSRPGARHRCEGRLGRGSGNSRVAAWEQSLVSSNTNSQYIPPELLEKQEHCFQDIQHWRVASMKLFSQFSHHRHDSEEYLAMTLMKIHLAMSTIALAQTFYPPENCLRRLPAGIQHHHQTLGVDTTPPRLFFKFNVPLRHWHDTRIVASWNVLPEQNNTSRRYSFAVCNEGISRRDLGQFRYGTNL